MAGEPVVTLIGNLTSDPDLRFTASGAAVCNFTVASTPRVKEGEEWVDGEAMFVRCAIWRQPAENAAETLARGMRVIVTGRMKVRSWEKDGQKRTGIEMDVDGVGPELRYATATVEKAGSGGGQRQSGGRMPQQSEEEPPF